jgi:hypothetical protein
LGNPLPTFSYAEEAEFAGDPNVQLELKQDGLLGAFILQANSNRLFVRGRHYVLRANGTVDEFLEPTLAVTTPGSNAILPQSRLNLPDRLEADLDLRDWSELRLNYRVDELQVAFFYRYPGQNEIRVPVAARLDPPNPTGRVIRYKADFKFPLPGLVQITFRITGPPGKERSAPWVQAQVAATGSRTISARFTNPLPGAGTPAFPAISSMVLCNLETSAQDFKTISSLEYCYAPVGSGSPTTGWITASALAAPAVATTREWPVWLAIPTNAAPGRYSLFVRDRDAFGQEDFRAFVFELIDVTPPVIVIDQPADGHVFVTNDPASLVIDAFFSVRDAQTAVDEASVAWTIGGPPQAPTNTGAKWYAQLQPGTYGAFDLRLTARDSASPTPNTARAVCRFEVVSSYRPATLQELLSRESYLRELLRFARSHLNKGNVNSSQPVTPQDLEANFLQPFEALARPNSPESTETASDVLVPIRLLRARERLETTQATDLDTAVALAAEAALVGRWDFAELASGARDGLIERFRGFGRFVLGGAYERRAGDQAIFDTALELTGKPGTPQEGAFRSTGRSRVVIGTPGTTSDWTARALALGRDNRDFSLSFWIYPEDSGTGTVRGVVFKGNESSADPAIFRRTPGIWLEPSENRIYFRITTAADINEGGYSAALLQTQAWTHLAYVKSGRRLRLYLNGLLDQEVVLRSAEIKHSLDPLYLGANPHYAGFVGALSEFRVYATPLGDEEVRHLAQDRRAGVPNVGRHPQNDASTVLHRYCNAAYSAMLRGLGTSREEMATLGTLSAAQRRALETRLGLAGLPWRPGQVLETLVPSNTTNVVQFEEFLAGNFGLPFTFWPTTGQQAPGGTPGVVQQRHAGLEQAYLAEDADPARWPDLDPDLVDWEELDPSAEAWRQLHIARSGELATMFRVLSDPNLTAIEMVGNIYSDSERRQLRQLGLDDAAGLPIADGLAVLSLDLPMLRQILVCLDEPANRPITGLQRTDLAHLLVEVWKRRTRRAAWVLEEAALPTRPWPGVAGPGAWVPGSYRRDFLPWRGNVRRRVALEDRLGARHRAFEALLRDHARLVLDVQRSTLPQLRDELLGIGDLPALAPRLGTLQQMLLTDLTAAGALDLSVVEQATASLQVLFNGIRRKWFGQGHPARTWSPLNDNNFDAQWGGIDTYGRWRSSVLNYLYVENTLYPELRQTNSTAFKDCLLKLRAIQPLTVAELEDATKPYAKAVANLVSQASPLERNFFLHVAEGLALQRADQFEAALRRYKEVFDVNATPPKPRLLIPEVVEPVGQPASASFNDLDWAARLQDPHARASREVGQRIGCKNPYTRFVLFQILHCMLAPADAAIARGTLDDRALARSLYLEAQDVLALDELVDVPPTTGGQAYLPNPLLEANRARAASGLRKLRLGLSALGLPMPPDPTRGAGAAGLSSLVRPTPYPYRLLVDRAKQQAGMAQQFEAQYLAAIERNEAELEKLMQQGFALELASQTVELRRRGITEAETGQRLAVLQEGRSGIERDRLKDWLAVGDNSYERQQITAMAVATDRRKRANVAEAAAAGAQAAVRGANLLDAILSGGTITAAGIVAATAIASGAGFRDSAIDQEAQSQLSNIYAARARRDEEWRLRRDLAEQDGLISAQGVQLAGDRLEIARQEVVIAEAQTTQAAQMFAFLRNKFTSAEFYDWLAGVLAETYGFFLQLAAAAARHAELQLAFERQEAPQRLVRADYWKLASSDGSRDRRGITGSARLLQDLYTLDQYAFSSERRLLNLTQSFSAERLMPVELEEFRRTGVLIFTTPMAWFDDGFPGHYLRLIKRVRISIAALIAPSVGVRATLSNGGLSRAVTADAGYPTMVIRQDPQSVALTSPTAGTGVFELDMQSDLLHPFEGTGVDTSWFLEMPRASNTFDFDSLMDVVISMDYTALFSADLRERVTKTLPRERVGDRVISVRRDLPDTWYDIANGQGPSVRIGLPVGRRLFPSGIEDVGIRELSLSARTTTGAPCTYAVVPSVARGPVATVAAQVVAIGGIVSSRQFGANAWRTRDQTQPAALLPSPVDADWSFEITNDPAGSNTPGTTFLDQLREGTVEDILIVFGFAGRRAAWPTF